MTKPRWEWMPDNSCTFACDTHLGVELVCYPTDTAYSKVGQRKGPYRVEIYAVDINPNTQLLYHSRKQFRHVADARAWAEAQRKRKRL